MSIHNVELANSHFENSNLYDLKIKNGVLDNIVFDESSVVPEELKYQIYSQTMLQPTEEFVDYINRVINNQLIEKLGFPDENPLSKFY